MEWETVAHEHGEHLVFNPIVGYALVEAEPKMGSGVFSIHPDTINQIEGLSGHSYIGYTMRDNDHDRSDAWVGSDIKDPVEWSTTLKHEMGHCMGLLHENLPVIMYPGWGSEVSRVVSCGDIQQYARLRDRPAPVCP